MSKPAKSYQFQEDTITCPLCSKNYTNPRLLPCLHSFCSDCLSNHVQNGGQQTQSEQKPTAGHGKSTRKESPTKQGHAAETSGKADHQGNTLKPGDAKGKPGQRSKSPHGGKSPTQGASPKPSKSPQQGKSDSKSVPPGKTPRATQLTKTAAGGPKPQHLSTSTGPTYQTGAKGFPCPCCKKFATTPQLPKTNPDRWAELFPENNLLADLVDLHSLKLGTKSCDPCRRNKKSAQVHSYCKICRDALCEPCALTHKGLRSCRNHKVLSTAQFADAINSLKVEEEFCSLHDGKTMERYCYTHSQLCCSQCIVENHKHCERTVPVADAATKAKEVGEISSLDTALQKYREHVEIVLKDRSNLIRKLDNKKGKLMDEFINVKKHIISQLEKMERDLKTILDATHKQESKKIKQEVDKCRDIQSGVVNSKEFLTLADQHGSNSQVISTIEKVKSECEYYEESIGILCSRIRAVDYDIALDNSLKQIMTRLNQFGRIDVNTTPAKLPPPPKLAATLGLQSFTTKAKAVKPTYTLVGKNANEIGEFCARSDDDSNDCWFTGALFLTDGRILLADRTNRKLKLFTSNFNPITELSLSSKPWDVTRITEKEVAVSLPAECRIQFVSIDGNFMSLVRSIGTDEPCFGICHTEGKILTVTYDGDPPNLKVLSMGGKELTYVCVDDDGFTLFSKPVYVACTPKASQIYVSDERLGCVVNLKETGELNFAYSAMDLGNAAGIALDTDGNIYVCGATSNSVHVVSPNGERVKVLITGEHITYPRAIAFEPREKKLLVTQGDQDIVKLYSLA
ncbi:TRIM9-like protein [Mya arenaria]|uniref:TRIM9-like protein n=1 Tax=Mya arenaria TaxID=6604 RepID=A0ABY7GAA4_MYAAR|nr:E3 ubiquitin-protein ligase TRIM9-like [Mya arenaria]WAR31345.1 TRIM9-like protein [Mya arenaria]